MKKYMIMVLVGMMYSNTSYANLLESLQRYCVPTSGAGCSADVKGTYDTDKGYCTCNSITKRYNSDNRACEECVIGSFASDNWKACEPIKCPDGYGPVLITNGACPTGYALQEVANGDCPSGYGLKEYNPTSKSWK